MYKAMWCGAVRKKIMTLKRHTTEMPIPKTRVNVQRTNEMKYTRCGLYFVGMLGVIPSDPWAMLD